MDIFLKREKSKPRERTGLGQGHYFSNCGVKKKVKEYCFNLSLIPFPKKSAEICSMEEKRQKVTLDRAIALQETENYPFWLKQKKNLLAHVTTK